MDRGFIERLKAQYSKPLTEDEKRLLQDMRFVIDFVLDHNVSMEVVTQVIGHDLEEIQQKGSLAEARSRGFLPKSHGFSNY